jgi:hypothetical protein
MKLGRILKAARPAPRKPTPVNSGLVSKKDPFFKSKEYKSFQEQQRGRPATMDMYKSPYFGDVGSGSFGRAQDEAYRKFKNIPDPTPRMISPGPTPPSGGAPGPINELRVDPFQKRGALPPSPPPSGGATGSTGFKSGFGGFDSNMFSNRMKKGGSVKASKAPKASSASKRGDGIATKGKTKGRMV